MAIRAPKASSASPPPPPENERAEIETMLRRLRRTASNSDLRSAYETATGSLDGVVYRLAMLRVSPAARICIKATGLKFR